MSKQTVSFLELFKDENTRDLAYDIIHYAMVKDGLQSRMGSFIRALAAEMIDGPINAIARVDDFFKGLLKRISTNGCDKLQEGFMKYASQYIRLNKRSELWIDEVQDLSIEYLNAMTRIMLETSVDINVVGDELQSLEYEHNF